MNRVTAMMVGGMMAAGLAGCGGGLSERSAAPETEVLSTSRVGGDAEAESVFADGQWQSGSAMIDTPLPEGYAAPTPPGALELKRYGTFRRAEVSGKDRWWGMERSFFPLFNHIQRRDIPMTSPVEIDHPELLVDGEGSPQPFTMSFLYRTRDEGPIGVDERDKRVRVVDTPAQTVLAVGFQGGYSIKNTLTHLGTLQEWLKGQSVWEAAGPARSLHYNGPNVPDDRKWGEVQVPVRPRLVSSQSR